MTIPDYSSEQYEFLDELREEYRRIANGVCMAAIKFPSDKTESGCGGPIGSRHSISKNHLKILSDCDGKIRANKENGTFGNWIENHLALQLVPITQFSAGKWSCQKHDERFAEIDRLSIDLSKQENLFKIVYRVVLRHSHLSLARWNAIFEATKSEEGWQHFKNVAFDEPVSDVAAEELLKQWRNAAHALMGKTLEWEKWFRDAQWDSLDCRAFLLKSEPRVAGWGCKIVKFDLSQLDASDPRHGWQDHREFGYMVVIPQVNGHAIVTACENQERFCDPEIKRIHEYIPQAKDPNEPYVAIPKQRQRIMQRFWGLNEIGLKEELYQSWPEDKRVFVQKWMKKSGRSPMVDFEDRDLNFLPELF